MSKYAVDTQGNAVPMPEQEQETTPEQVPSPEPEQEDLSDLFTVTREDTSDLTEVSDEDVMGEKEDELPGEDDMSDLFEVSNEDVMGQPAKRKPVRRLKRTIRRYIPPTSVGGQY